MVEFVVLREDDRGDDLLALVQLVDTRGDNWSWLTSAKWSANILWQ